MPLTEQRVDVGSNRLAVLGVEIRSEHEAAQHNNLLSAQHAYEAGKRLMEARDRDDIPRGGWDRWVEEVAGVPKVTAWVYMKLFNAVEERRLTVNDIAVAGQMGVLRMLRTEDARARREASRAAPEIADGMDLRIGDCRAVLSDIEDNSIPLILTDPPYSDEAEPLWHWLAQFAARILFPGGALICYFGGARLNRLYRILDEAGLEHWWPAAMLHDQSQRFLGKSVIVNHKPILWYVNDFRRGRSLVPDVVRSTRDKSAHPWAQGDGGVEQWIEHLTEAGETIVDPFAGTAAWGRIAVGKGRRWIGADIALGGTETIAADEYEEVAGPTEVAEALEQQKI